MRRSRTAAVAVSAAIVLVAMGSGLGLADPGALAGARAQTASAQRAHRPAPKPDPWPDWSYNGAATSYNSAEHTLRPATVGKIVKKWEVPAYSGDRAAFPPVAVHAGTLYEANPKHIAAYSMSTGRHLRSFPLSRAGSAIVTPAIDGSRMITTIGPDLAAIDLSTGKLDWEVPEPQTSTLFNQWGSLTVSGSTVFADLLTESFTPAYSTTDQLEAFSAATGQRLWSAADAYGPIAVGGGIVYDAASGVVIEPGAREEPTVDVEIHGYNETTGVLSWDYPLTDNPYISGIAYADSTVLVTDTTNDAAGSDIYAVDAQTGVLRWDHAEPPPSGGLGPNGGNIVTDGKRVVYAHGDPTRLVALSVANGHVLWRRAEGGFSDHVIGADGVIYADSANDHLRAFRLSDGKTLWTTHGKVLGPVLVADGRLLADIKTHYVAYGRK